MRKEQWVRVCGKGTRKLRGENEVANWLKAKGEEWRRGWESNPRIKVLQTSPLPLGYRASALQYSETVPHFQPGRFGRGRKTALLIFNCEQRFQSRYRFNGKFANEETGVPRRDANSLRGASGCATRMACALAPA